MKFLRRAAVLVAAGAIVVGVAPPASAHAVVVSTTPFAGSVLSSPPAQVTLRFGEPVEITPSGIRVYDDELHRVDDGHAQRLSGQRDTVGVGLAPNLATGTYTVTYRIISGDSHPVAGRFTFSVGAASSVRGVAADLDGGSTVVGIAFGTARFVEYAGLSVGLGGLVFFVLWPAGRRDRGSRRLVFGGFVALLAGSVAALLLEVPYVTGEGLGTMFDRRLLSTVATSHFGIALIMRAAVVALILALFRRLLDRGPYGYPYTVTGLAVVLADTFADAGHSTVNDNYGLAQLSDGAHVLAMTVWLGGLVMLVVVVLRRHRDALRTVLPRFSAVALGCIAVIAGTGAYQAIRNVGYWPALTDTAYGRLVLTKIAGLAAIGCLGYLAKRWVAQHTSGRAGDVVAFRRGLMVEVATGVAVLAVTAVLVATLPGKTAYAAPVSRTIVTSAFRLDVTVDPAKTGPATIRGRARSPHGGPLTMQEVTGSLWLPAQAVGPLPVSFAVTGGGRAVAALTLAAPGRWQLVLNVAASPADVTTVATTFTVA